MIAKHARNRWFETTSGLVLAAALGASALGALGCGTKANKPGAAGGPEAKDVPAASASAAEAKLPPPVRFEGSALARNLDGTRLYVADEDHDTLRILKLPIDPAAPVGAVKLPGPPAQVLVRGEEIFVTVREPGLLIAFVNDGDTVKEAYRVALPADAWGLGLSPDQRTLAVSSAWTHQLSLVDLRKHAVTATLDLAREPRGIVFAPNGDRLYVTHLVGTQLTRVDLGPTPKVSRVELPADPLHTAIGATTGASLGYAATLSSDGHWLFVPRHALGTSTQPASYGITGDWFGRGTVDALALEGDVPVAPARAAIASVQRDQHVVGAQGPWPGVRGTIPSGQGTVSQPRDIVRRKKTDTLLVVSEGDDRLVELEGQAIAPAVTTLTSYLVGEGYDAVHGIGWAAKGGAPQGVALSADEDTAWLYCRSTFDVVQVKLDDPFAASQKPRELWRSTKPKPSPPVFVSVGEEPLDKNGREGRRLFYSALDEDASQGLACAGCHPEGRDDGYTYHAIKHPNAPEDAVRKTLPGSIQSTLPESSFVAPGDDVPEAFFGHPSAAVNTRAKGFPRQTPMLAGRVSAAGPYGWHAQNKTLDERVMEGFRIHRFFGENARKDTQRASRAQFLKVFVRKGLRPPPKLDRPLTAQETQGKALFEDAKTACVTCHPPATEYTTRAAVPLKVALPTLPRFDAESDRAFKVPSLLFLAGTAPYYHDGSVETLEALIDQNGNRMGQTQHLSAEEKAALVAFLKTL